MAVLGDEAADTLMNEISSLGRDQVATRHDLELLGLRMKAEFHEAIAMQTRQLGIWMLGAMTTLMALAFSAARFA